MLSELGLRGICDGVSEGQNHGFDLGEITEHLVAGRMLDPSSKLATFKWCQGLVEPPAFAEHQVYRALSVLSEKSDEIQAALYRASGRLRRRRCGVLYYDCTNYFFEVECADINGDRQYGASKEHRPNPIVQMGLFMDANGIPLAFRIAPGNTSEQTTLKPLEQTILDEFGESRFVVCTDAGISSKDNRLFNTQGGRAFVTVQSIKKMKAGLREWALDRTGWMLPGSDRTYDLREWARWRCGSASSTRKNGPRTTTASSSATSPPSRSFSSAYFKLAFTIPKLRQIQLSTQLHMRL